MAETNTISGSISFTGLGSGTDFTTMIDQLLEVESIHKKRLELWRTEWETKNAAFQELNTKLLSLKTTLGSMDSLNEFLVKTASSTADTYVTATVNAEAEEGAHYVQVNRLAQNAILTDSTAYADSADAFTLSDITWNYHYAGQDYSLNVAANTTVQEFVNLFNSNPDNPGVRMSTLSDGTNTFLQVRGLDMGDDADLVVSSAGWAVTQTNQSSQIRVDGWPTSGWIESDSNSVDNVVPGVTFQLKDTTGIGSALITVATDKEAIKEKVRNFVSAVNDVRSLIRDLTKVTKGTKTIKLASLNKSIDITSQGSLLTGNYGVQLIDSQLKSAIASKAVGFEYYNAATGQGDKLTSLSQIGILTDAEEGSVTNGLLTLDEEALDEALEKYPDLVAELFAIDSEGASDSSDFGFYSQIDGITKAGKYGVKYTVDAAGDITSASINGVAATWDNTTHTITSQDTGGSRGMVVKVNNFTAGSYEGNIRLKEGKMQEMDALLADLTNSTTGPLHILEDNYDDIMKSIDEKIDYEDKRLLKMEQTLRAKYARLEATLGYYDKLQTSLSNQVNQLSSN
ncbi:MAG: flagellar filament capping protein FliD [Desulfovibrionaceae bacterium]|jgi:flagellar hook-associated protein 2|nr:flagellar filament capping protein FliD [Desulfovibrionaceae bacterium]